MANLIVTFGKSLGGKLEYGADARTEELEITGGHTETGLVASGAEDVVTLYAQADCWVVLASNPDAEAADVGANRRFMKEGWQRQFAATSGMKVATTSA